jgi:hypothetical protein
MYALRFKIEIQFSLNLSFIRSILVIDILLFINLIWELKNDLRLLSFMVLMTIKDSSLRCI